jgi:hypothetical protein
MSHTQLNLNDFQTAVKESDTFKNFETFKKGIVLKRKNIDRLYDYYQQACRYGTDYLKGNPNIFRSDFALISEIIEK